MFDFFVCLQVFCPSPLMRNRYPTSSVSSRTFAALSTPRQPVNSERLLRWTIDNLEKARTLDCLSSTLRAAVVDSRAFSDPSSVIRDEHRRFIDCSFRHRAATIYIVGDPVNDWSHTIDVTATLHVPIVDYIFRIRSVRQCLAAFNDTTAELLARIDLIEDNPQKNG